MYTYTHTHAHIYMSKAIFRIFPFFSFFFGMSSRKQKFFQVFLGLISDYRNAHISLPVTVNEIS